MAALFGIHVGNTSACIALCKDDDRVEVLANDTGDRLTPTTVQWTPGQYLVGKGAVLEQFRYLSSTIVRNKQLLNDKIDSQELEELRTQVPYKIHVKDSSVRYEVVIEGKQHNITAKSVALAIFEKLYAIAATSVTKGIELQAVLTIPVYFSTSSVSAIRDIASKAGFTVLQIIDDASASLLAVLPPSNDDWYITDKMKDLLISEFNRQYKGQEITERGKFKLQAVADTAKQILSIQSVAQCSAESVGGGFDLSCTVSRPRLENMVYPLLSQISGAITKVLTTANVAAENVVKGVLCGGTVKIPRVQEQIRSILPNAELLGGNIADEIIAVGAAQQARCCRSAELELPHTLALDMSVMSGDVHIKVTNKEGEDVYTKSVLEGSMLPVFVNAKLPANSSSVIVSNGEMSGSPCVLPVLNDCSLDLRIDKEGIMKITLLEAKS